MSVAAPVIAPPNAPRWPALLPILIIGTVIVSEWVSAKIRHAII